MGPLSRWAVNKPWWALAAWAVLVGVIVFLGTAVKGTLNDSFELPDTESLQAQELLEKVPGASEATTVNAKLIWGTDSGTVTDPAVVAAVTPLLTKLSTLPGVACVTNPYSQTGEGLGPDCPKPQAPALPSTLPAEQKAAFAAALQASAKAVSPISADGDVAYSTVRFTAVEPGDVPLDTAKAVLDASKELNGVDGLQAGANGSALTMAGAEPPSSEAIGLVVALIILLLAFGSFLAAMLPLLTALFGVSLGGLLLLFFARFGDVATFAPTLAAMIGLGVGIDYSLFVINRYRQAIHAGHEPRKAALEAVNTSGRAVVFAATTVIIALLGLFVLGINFFNGLALAASGTVLLVMLSAVWLLPALLSLLGARAVTPVSGLISNARAKGGAPRVVAIVALVLIWLWALALAGSTVANPDAAAWLKVVVAVVALGAAAAATWGYRFTRHYKETQEWHPEGGNWAHYGRLLQRRPIIPTLLALAVVVVLAIPTLSLRLGFPDDSGTPEGTPGRIAYDLSAEGFGAGTNGPFFVAVELPKAGDAAALGQLVGALEATDGVASTIPSTAMMPILAAQLAQSGDTVTAVQVVPKTGPQDEATSDLLTALRETTIPKAGQATGVKAYVGGFTAITEDFAGVLARAMPLFLAIVVGLGFLALLVLFRSPVVSLTAVVTSLLSFGAALGITVAVFQWGWLAGPLGISGTGPIVPFLPVMVFAILFGLAMDYHVFLVSRMQEEWGRTKDNATSVRRGLAGSGRVVMMAALIMASVFAAFIPDPNTYIKVFGVSLASAVLIDAFVVRLVLVPSLMSLLGNANWWLPRWLDKVLPHFSVEGGEDEVVDDVTPGLEPGAEEAAPAGAR